MEAKNKVKTAQSKLLKFLQRFKIHDDVNTNYKCYTSFESLMLLIGNDRRQIYDRMLKNKPIPEPELLLEISR